MHFLKFFKTIFQETKRYDPEDYELWKQALETPEVLINNKVAEK